MVVLNASTALRVGPIHGVQPRPKTTPSSGAPAIPVLGWKDIRRVFCRNGSQPMSTRPIRITNTPKARISASCHCNSHPPITPKAAP